MAILMNIPLLVCERYEFTNCRITSVVCRTSEPVDNLTFHQIVESETACDGKQYSENRYNGKQGAVSQCRGFVYYPVFGEAVDTKVDGLDDIVYGKSGSRNFIFCNTPDVVSKKLPEGCNTSIHKMSISVSSKNYL